MKVFRVWHSAIETETLPQNLDCSFMLPSSANHLRPDSSGGIMPLSPTPASPTPEFLLDFCCWLESRSDQAAFVAWTEAIRFGLTLLEWQSSASLSRAFRQRSRRMTARGCLYCTLRRVGFSGDIWCATGSFTRWRKGLLLESRQASSQTRT